MIDPAAIWQRSESTEVDRYSMIKQTMRQMTRVASVAGLAVLAFGSAVPSASASGTPDDYWAYYPNAGVMWNDYDSENHRKDYDNVIIMDTTADSFSVELNARNTSNGRSDTAHAWGYNDTDELDLGNVRKGDKVEFYYCLYRDGEQHGCTEEDWFSE